MESIELSGNVIHHTDRKSQDEIQVNNLFSFFKESFINTKYLVFYHSLFCSDEESGETTGWPDGLQKLCDDLAEVYLSMVRKTNFLNIFY
jgi:hypothetical protein